jgi:hypothetical protein
MKFKESIGRLRNLSPEGGEGREQQQLKNVIKKTKVISTLYILMKINNMLF